MARSRKILIGLALTVLAAGAAVYCWQHFRFQHRPTPPNIHKVGGTILVYEVDTARFPDGVPPANFSMDHLAETLRRRIDPTGEAGVAVRPVGDLRIEISVPRHDKDHKDDLDRVRNLITHIGKLSFLIVADTQDDNQTHAGGPEVL